MSQKCICVVMWESRNSKGEILSGFRVGGGAVEPVTTHFRSTEYNAETEINNFKLTRTQSGTLIFIFI